MSELKGQLEQTVLRILEETAFVFPMPAGGPDSMETFEIPDLGGDELAMPGEDPIASIEPGAAFAGPSQEWLGVSVLFRGGLSGKLELWADVPLAAEICANMLGAMDGVEPPPTAQVDSLKEVLNILCGNLVTEIAGTEHVVALDAPETIEAACPGFDPLTGGEESDRTLSAAFDVDGQRLWIRLELAEGMRAA